MSERHDVLAQAIERLEGLRLERPMNGDGSNYMLNKAINRLAETEDLQQVAAAAEVAHRERWSQEFLEQQRRYPPAPVVARPAPQTEGDRDHGTD